MRDDLPARIDRYEPLRLLAVGGMAEIFLAKQSGLEGFEKVVVIKRILPSLAQDEEFVQMFRDEARIAAKLSHPNIVQIYDLGRTDDTDYIAMEYVSGRNCQHLITKQLGKGANLPVEHALRIVAGVCDGLFYAHSRKDFDGKPMDIIHRDISPQNILVSFAGGVKLVDFGIAKASTQLAQTRAGVLKGKYAYMSPEQVKGGKIDHRSDLFSLGLVMYELLTGVRAFERENSLKTLKAIVQEKPINPREYNPDLPMEAIKLLSKALEKNPDRRYKNAQEMQLAIEDYLEVSPRKSNNVKLSRFMYDLFEDELNSAEGTLVVPGVGQVIIPTSQSAGQVKPAIEEEIDSKTLTAVLADVPPGARPAATATPSPFSRSPGMNANLLAESEPAEPTRALTPSPLPALPPPPAHIPPMDDPPEFPHERTMISPMEKPDLPTADPGPPAYAMSPAQPQQQPSWDPSPTRPLLTTDELPLDSFPAQAEQPDERYEHEYDEPIDRTVDAAGASEHVPAASRTQFALLGTTVGLGLMSMVLVAVGFFAGGQEVAYGQLVLRGVPADAVVKVDGKPHPTDALLPMTGSHTIDVSVAGTNTQHAFVFGEQDVVEVGYPFPAKR
jgi:eukaryotic-like serine/threonine-protein kinase